MRIYLAARYARKLELRGYARQAELKGIHVGAEWLKESSDPNASLYDATGNENSDNAIKDWWDIGACDVFVFFAEPHDKQPPRGARHVEFGIAVAQGKKIVVIGEPENIFHYLPFIDIDFFNDWNSALSYLSMGE